MPEATRTKRTPGVRGDSVPPAQGVWGADSPPGVRDKSLLPKGRRLLGMLRVAARPSRAMTPASTARPPRAVPSRKPHAGLTRVRHDRRRTTQSREKGRSPRGFGGTVSPWSRGSGGLIAPRGARQKPPADRREAFGHDPRRGAPVARRDPCKHGAPVAHRALRPSRMLAPRAFGMTGGTQLNREPDAGTACTAHLQMQMGDDIISVANPIKRALFAIPKGVTAS